MFGGRTGHSMSLFRAVHASNHCVMTHELNVFILYSIGLTTHMYCVNDKNKSTTDAQILLNLRNSGTKQAYNY